MLSGEVRGSPMNGGGGSAVMAHDLARGLTYLRASNMQVMRLQLAMEQQDRRGVMAAIDELVGLDRELGRFIDSIPDPELADVGREIDGQKRELIAQRLVLARGKVGPALAPVAVPARGVESEPAIIDLADYEEYRPPRRWPLVIAFLLILATAAALWLAFGGLDTLQPLISAWELPA